jgi:hypothetical protein
MNNKLRLLPDTLQADGLVRTAIWEYREPLYSKNVSFQIPNYAVPITFSPMINLLDIRLRIDHLLKAHSKFYLMKLHDIDILMYRLRATRQSTLDGSLPDEVFQRFFLNNIMILDHSPESLYYTKNLKRYSNSSNLLPEIRSVAKRLVEKREKLDGVKYQEYKEKKIEEMWKAILSTDKTLNAFLAKIHETAIALYGDVILPFTKLISTKQDLKDIEKINDIWMALNAVEDKPTVAYLLLSPTVLRNDLLLVDIIDYIQRLKADIIVIKVKNLRLTDGSTHAKPRESMRLISETVANKKQQNRDLLTICLECGEQLYPLAIQAFDVVSTSASMYDLERESGGTAEVGYGKALDEETLALTDYDEWAKAFNRLGYFACSHEICRSNITTMDKERYFNKQWWIDSRIHNILTIDGWLDMIGISVLEQTSDLAIDRLRNSPIRVLTELLVRNYQDSDIF